MIYRYATHNVSNLLKEFSGCYGGNSEIKIVMHTRSKTAYVSLYNKTLDRYTRIGFQYAGGKLLPIYANNVAKTTRKQLETFTRNYMSVDEKGFLQIDGRKFQKKFGISSIK